MMPSAANRPFTTPEQMLEELNLPFKRSALYEALRRGEITGARRIGRRWVIPTAVIERWVNGEE
jgi:Helix-turn-helix domain